MNYLVGDNWTKALVPDTPLLQIFVRGSVIYLALFFFLRLVLQREAGGMGLTDLLVIVLIADAAQNGMAGNYQSIGDGLLLTAVIIFWAYMLDWLPYHIPALERVFKPRSLLLVKDGRILQRNMHRELITRLELMSQLREQGLTELSQVRQAWMEPDGRISVIPVDEGQSHGHRREHRSY